MKLFWFLACILVFILIFMSKGYTETLPEAPGPHNTETLPEVPGRHETRNFVISSLYFSLSSEALNYADHAGARECKREDIQGGAGNLFNTSKSYGFAPRTGEIFAGGAAVLGGATILELLHYRKLAKRVLVIGGSAQYGAAVAAYWSGCN